MASDAAALRAVRQRGWAASVAEREPGVASVSAPVHGPDGVGHRGALGEWADRPARAQARSEVRAGTGAGRRAAPAGSRPGRAGDGPRQRRFTTAKQTRNLPRLAVAAMDVVLVRWPEENLHLGELRGTGTPRLLLVGPDAAPPDSVDPLEDWIRLPADDQDVRARVATLEARASNGLAVPGDRRGRTAAVQRPLGLVVAGRARARRCAGRALRRRGRAGADGPTRVADRCADPQRARRAHPAAASSHRAARPRGPHGALPRLPPADHHGVARRRPARTRAAPADAS